MLIKVVAMIKVVARIKVLARIKVVTRIKVVERSRHGRNLRLIKVVSLPNLFCLGDNVVGRDEQRLHPTFPFHRDHLCQGDLLGS